MDPAIDFAAQQAGGFEDAKVLRNGRERDVKRGSQFGDGSLAMGKAGEDGAACWVGEGAEGGIENAAGMVNHMV